MGRPLRRSMQTVGKSWTRERPAGVFESLDALVEGLPNVFALDRALVRARALERFNPDRMVDAYLAVYARLAASSLRHAPQGGRR